MKFVFVAMPSTNRRVVVVVLAFSARFTRLVRWLCLFPLYIYVDYLSSSLNERSRGKGRRREGEGGGAEVHTLRSTSTKLSSVLSTRLRLSSQHRFRDPGKVKARLCSGPSSSRLSGTRKERGQSSFWQDASAFSPLSAPKRKPENEELLLMCTFDGLFRARRGTEKGKIDQRERKNGQKNGQKAKRPKRSRRASSSPPRDMKNQAGC